VESFRAAQHVVITGGEPMIAKDIVTLSEALKKLGVHITIETAGTVWAPVKVDLFSISPKLSNSTPREEAWRGRHEERRANRDVLKRMLSHAPYQLKFVVSSENDLAEIRDLVALVGVQERWRVLLMPESRSVTELEARQEWVAQACKNEGFRFCDRLHLRLYGNTPGT
jgi:7-carboxy-7-deazaguanine synthase